MNKIVKLITENREMRAQIVIECERDGDPLTQQALDAWRKLRYGVPPKRVAVVSRVTGLPMHVIRPDIFPRPSRAIQGKP